MRQDVYKRQVFMMDIYRPIFNPNLSEEKTVALAKKVGWGFALFAIVFTPFLDVLSAGLYDFGRSFTGSVSYTHLDVYKRQAMHPLLSRL